MPKNYFFIFLIALLLCLLLVAGALPAVSTEVYDVGVTILGVSPTMVLPVRYVTVGVLVENKGTVTVTFNVTMHCDNYTPRYKSIKTVTDLLPGSNLTLTFKWNAYYDLAVIFPSP